MKAFIQAISYYLPEKVITNEDLARAFPDYTVEKVASKIGVMERHLAAPDQTSADMAAEAALKLFKEYDISINKYNDKKISQTSYEELLYMILCYEKCLNLIVFL